MFKLLLLTVLTLTLHSDSLKSALSQMIIIGFEGEKVPKKLATFIQKNGIGGVILFSKNIKNPSQLKALTQTLHQLDSKLLIATDQEGGLVERLNHKNGFFDTPKPIEVAKMGKKEATMLYHNMAKMLASSGINVNFAPCVDLAKNPNNSVIVKYGRAFSSKPQEVIIYGQLFIDAMQKEGVLSVIKHFPGHGSSKSDSHKGFVDVTHSWSREELLPFFNLQSHAIMSAHIYNHKLDPLYPATLSKATIGILRKSGFNGIVISDDIQMKAIRENYDLNTTITKAIAASVDIILVGNQLADPISIEEIVNKMEALVKKGDISLRDIEAANRRIKAVKKELYARR